MIRIIEWQHAFTIPFADNVHDVLKAFLRTSIQGEWRFDESAEIDNFVLHLRRGKWKKSLFGGLSPAFPTNDPKATPMTLRITLRPTSSEVLIRLYHWFHYNFVEQSQRTAEMEKWYGNYVSREVAELARYLRDFYRLPELPEIA
ncbi:MAG: hypothetical protein JSS27_11660 [Planctomycetes bacterium]|nr:hypothetical protein [Planctomycetota bacterium]